MFNYVPIDKSKLSYHATTEQVATIEELEALCRAKQVDRVIIPMTFDFEGYGADLISLSNSRSIKRDYKSRVKAYGHELSISAWQFLKHEEFREMIETLQNDYPLYDDEDHSMLENETHEQHLVDELDWAIRQDSETFKEDWSEDKIREVLHSGGWTVGELDQLEWWELVQTDNDGLTPYMKEEDFTAFIEVFKARAIELGLKL